eukprot:g61018.t1
MKPKWSRVGTDRVREYLFRQATPTVFACALEEYQLEVVSLFSMRLGSNEVAALQAMLQVYFFMSSFMFGLTAANNVTVSNYLGANQPRKAKAASRLTFVVAGVLGVIIGSGFYILRNVMGPLFSPDKEVQRLMAKSALVLGICYMGLTVFYASMSAVQATGRPHLVAISYLFGAWFVAVPLSHRLAFRNGYGLMGLWFGLCAGYFVVTATVAVVYLRTDFPEMARRAMLRSEAGKAHAATESSNSISNTSEVEATANGSSENGVLLRKGSSVRGTSPLKLRPVLTPIRSKQRPALTPKTQSQLNSLNSSNFSNAGRGGSSSNLGVNNGTKLAGQGSKKGGEENEEEGHGESYPGRALGMRYAIGGAELLEDHGVERGQLD